MWQIWRTNLNFSSPGSVEIYILFLVLAPSVVINTNYKTKGLNSIVFKKDQSR